MSPNFWFTSVTYKRLPLGFQKLIFVVVVVVVVVVDPYLIYIGSARML